MSLKIDRVQLEVVIKQDKARQKIIELEKQIAETNRTVNKTKKLFGETSAEYKHQMDILTKLKQEYDDVVESIGINNLSVKELAIRSKELNQILRNLSPNTKEYAIYSKQLDEVNSRLKELKGSARATSTSFEKFADGFNRYAGVAAGAIASITGIAVTMKGCVDEFAEMAEAESGVTKYAGMAKDAVEDLNNEFKKLDTRTGRDKLNALASDAGRLGKKSKQELMEFVDAGNMINVALGEDLGEKAVFTIGKLNDIFSDGSRSMKDGMLSIGSAINYVAQNSSAAEEYLVDFTARLGGTGKQAKMSVTDIMGFASALDQNMIRSEMASTALQKLIMSIYKEPVRFAELAGIQVKEFTELVKTDANEAVLTFLEALSRLGGMEALSPVLADMKLEGTEAASVIASLASNVDKIRHEQIAASRAFEEGSSIIEEYNVQNNTVQAELDKAKKRFKEVRIELGQKLQPAMKHMISTGSLTVKMLSAVVGFLSKYGRALATTAVTVGTYTAAVKLNVAAIKLHTVWSSIATAKTKLATAATAAWNAVLAANPLNILIAGIAGLVSYLVLFRKETDSATESQKKLNEELGKLSQDDKDIIKSVKARYNNINNLNRQQRERLKEDAQMQLDIIANRIADQESLFREDYRQRVENMKKYNPKGVWTGMIKTFDKELAANMHTLDEMRRQAKELTDIINGIPTSNDDLFTSPVSGEDKKLKEKQEKHDKKEAESRAKSYRDKIAQIKRSQDIEITLLDNQRALNLIKEEDYYKRMYELQVRFLTQRISTLKEYNHNTEAEELEMINLMTDESNRIYLEKMANKPSSEPEKKIEGAGIVEEEAPNEDNYLIEKFKQTQDGKLALLEAFHEAGAISEEEYQDRLNKIAAEKAEERQEITKASMQTVSDLAGSLSQLMGAMQDGEMAKVSRRYDKQIKAAKKAGKDTTKLEEKKEAEMADIRKKYADKQFAMSVLQITSTTAVTAMEAYKAMAGIPLVGPALGAAAAAAAVAAGVAQIAVAKQQRDDAKGLKSGGYSDDYVEGYTSHGNPDDVAGVIPVHKNEFVTNHKGVNNPHVKAFLDVFDMAQKDGTIGMINTTQILERVRTRAGLLAGGYSDKSSADITTGTNFGQILQLILYAIRDNGDKLESLLQKDLCVDVRDVRDKISRVNKLERNATR